MRSPSVSLGSPRLLALGQFLLAALVEESSTTTLAETFRPAFVALETTAAATAAALAATIHPRVALRFSERRLEQVIRNIARAAQTLDGGKAGGAVALALFPDGINAAVRPMGIGQVEAAQGLLNRLLAYSTAASLLTVHEPLLRTAIADMSTKLVARNAATTVYDVAMANEQAARANFCRGYDAMAGTLRSRFPKDRAAQSLFFDNTRARRASDDGDTPSPAVDAPSAS